MTLWLMTLRIAAVALLTVVSAFWMPARAQGNEPVVYVFWGQSCPYSQRVMTYIKKMRKADPKLRVQDYEVEGNPANAAAHERVLERIGITGVSVMPVTIVGENVLIGFASDDISGARIEGFVDQCRIFGCPDRVFDLMPDKHPGWTVTTLAPNAPACTSQSRTLRIGGPAR